jgi:hypothetical protein
VIIELSVRIFVPGGDWLQPSWSCLLITAMATAVALRWQVSAIWLVLGGAAAGWALWYAGWPIAV